MQLPLLETSKIILMIFYIYLHILEEAVTIFGLIKVFASQ